LAVNKLDFKCECHLGEKIFFCNSQLSNSISQAMTSYCRTIQAVLENNTYSLCLGECVCE